MLIAINEKMWCFPILNFKAHIQRREDVIVWIMDKCWSEVGDSIAIFGKIIIFENSEN